MRTHRSGFLSPWYDDTWSDQCGTRTWRGMAKVVTTKTVRRKIDKWRIVLRIHNSYLRGTFTCAFSFCRCLYLFSFILPFFLSSFFSLSLFPLLILSQTKQTRGKDRLTNQKRKPDLSDAVWKDRNTEQRTPEERMGICVVLCFPPASAFSTSAFSKLEYAPTFLAFWNSKSSESLNAFLRCVTVYDYWHQCFVYFFCVL